MGLLDKTNPTATRNSVIQQALIWGAIAIFAFSAYFVWAAPQNLDWLFVLPIAGLAGAALGALMEWQLDDGLEIYHVMREVEQEFGVKIPNWNQIETVDDLFRVTLSELNRSASTFEEEEIWFRLKGLLVREFALKPERIVPSARFYIELPM